MNETEFEDALKTLLEELHFMDEQDRQDAGLPDEMAEATRVRTYAEAGVLAGNAGLVITLADGSKFEVTIVQSC